MVQHHYCFRKSLILNRFKIYIVSSCETKKRIKYWVFSTMKEAISSYVRLNPKLVDLSFANLLAFHFVKLGFLYQISNLQLRQRNAIENYQWKKISGGSLIQLIFSIFFNLLLSLFKFSRRFWFSEWLQMLGTQLWTSTRIVFSKVFNGFFVPCLKRYFLKCYHVHIKRICGYI